MPSNLTQSQVTLGIGHGQLCGAIILSHPIKDEIKWALSPFYFTLRWLSGKNLPANAGGPGLILVLGRSPEEGFPSGSAGKESACNAGDLGSIPGLGRCPGEGNGYPFQYSGLENSVDCIVYGVAKSWTQLSDFHFHFFFLKKEVAAHSSILAWEMPWTEEPRGLQFMGSQRVGHDLATEHEHTRVI